MNEKQNDGGKTMNDFISQKKNKQTHLQPISNAENCIPQEKSHVFPPQLKMRVYGPK